MQTQQLDLDEIITHILDECRMVLPGIQALFGFQLIAVFNQRFESLSFQLQFAHLSATTIVALAAGVVMTPAAYHRMAEPRIASERMVALSTRLLLSSLVLLATGISTDLYVISRLIFSHAVIPAFLSISVFISFLMLWFGVPAIFGCAFQTSRSEANG
jgi:hypothetical protein